MLKNLLMVFAVFMAQQVLAQEQYVLAVYNPPSYGSGVAISPNQVATSCHTLRNGRKIGVMSPDTKIKVSTEKGMSRSGKDTCILHFDTPHGFPVPPIGNSGSLTSGSKVVAIGWSSSILSRSDGVVIGLEDQLGGGRVINTTAYMEPGASGGGLFDANGNLVGLLTYITRDNLGNNVGNYSVPIEWAKEMRYMNPVAINALAPGGEFWRASK